MLATPDFWVLVSFVGFVALVVYLKVPGRIAGALDDRAVRIKKELDEAQKLREEAQGLLAAYQRKRRDAEAEASEIIDQAKAEAERLKLEAQEQLQEMIQRRQKQAELKISQAEEQALADVRAAAADAALAAAEQIIARKLTGKAATDLTAQSIAQVKDRLQ